MRSALRWLRRSAATTTVAVPYNDLQALESALKQGDIACVLMEPALTNIVIVLPVDVPAKVRVQEAKFGLNDPPLGNDKLPYTDNVDEAAPNTIA